MQHVALGALVGALAVGGVAAAEALEAPTQRRVRLCGWHLYDVFRRARRAAEAPAGRSRRVRLHGVVGGTASPSRRRVAEPVHVFGLVSEAPPSRGTVSRRDTSGAPAQIG